MNIHVVSQVVTSLVQLLGRATYTRENSPPTILWLEMRVVEDQEM